MTFAAGTATSDALAAGPALASEGNGKGDFSFESSWVKASDDFAIGLDGNVKRATHSSTPLLSQLRFTQFRLAM